MPRKLRIKFWSTTAAAAKTTGQALYNPDPGNRAYRLKIPAEYARIYYPTMYLLWATAFAIQIGETFGGTSHNPLAANIPAWVAANAQIANFLIRFGNLAFAFTLLLIPPTIIAVNTGRLLMKFAQRIEERMLPKHVRAEIETAIADTRREVNAQWNTWLDRRDAAMAQGKDFTEPPPGAS